MVFACVRVRVRVCVSTAATTTESLFATLGGGRVDIFIIIIIVVILYRAVVEKLPSVLLLYAAGSDGSDGRRIVFTSLFYRISVY